MNGVSRAAQAASKFNIVESMHLMVHQSSAHCKSCNHVIFDPFSDTMRLAQMECVRYYLGL